MYTQLKAIVKKNRAISNIYRKLIKSDVVEQKFMDLEEKIIYKYIFDLEKRVQHLEAKLNIEPKSPKVLTSGEQEPSLDNPISQVATSSQLKSTIYRNWCEKLRLPIYPNRKTWEFVYICQILQKHDLINPGKSGVGFGVGKDPMVAYFAKNNVKILATDLDIQNAKDSGWVHTNQYSKNILDLNEKGLVSDSHLKSLVNFKYVNMNKIPSDINNFDFTWSACAFEHLGSIEKGLIFLRNSLKCIKPGGIAVHTTEYNVTSNDNTVDNQGTVLFRKKDFEKIAKELRAEGHSIELNFSTGNSSFDQYYDIPPYSDYTHLKLLIGQHVSPSIGITIQKSL
jgi:hypothetical protein